MPSNTHRAGRAAAWLAVVLAVAGGIVGLISRTWSTVAEAAALLAIAAVVLVVGRQARSRR